MDDIPFLDDVALGDCIMLMDYLPNDCIDMVLCDLPYGITSRNEWDEVIPFDKLWSRYMRVAKDNAAFVFTATMGFAAKLISSKPDLFRYDIVWQKNKPTGFLNAKKMPMRVHENILVFYKSLPTYNPQKTQGHKPVNAYTKHSSDGTNYGKTKTGVSGGGQTDRYPTSIVPINVTDNISRRHKHPTQKPVALFEYLIKTYTNQGDIVLDNCMGSGTTALAAMRTGRRFIGMELVDKYHAAAKQEIAREKQFYILDE